MTRKYAGLIGNRNGCKENPRDTTWNQRANTGVKSLAMKRAKLQGLSLADYLEKLVLADLKKAG